MGIVKLYLLDIMTDLTKQVRKKKMTRTDLGVRGKREKNKKRDAMWMSRVGQSETQTLGRSRDK